MSEEAEALLLDAQRLTDEASVLWNNGSYPGTEELCRQALKATRKAVGDHDRRVAESLYNLATLYHFQRRFDEAKPLLHEAILIHEGQAWIDHSALAFCYAWMAKTHLEAWRDNPSVDGDEEGRSFDKAESCYGKALSLLERSGSTDRPEYAACLLQFGFLLSFCDRHSEAEPLLREALALREEIFGPDHLETAEVIGRLALLYLHAPSIDVNPEPLIRRALEIRRSHLPPTDPEVLEWTFRLAEYCSGAGRHVEADALYGRLGDALLDEAVPLDYEVDWIVSGYLTFLSETEQTAREAEIRARWRSETQAVRLKRAELARCEMMLGAEHPRVAGALRALADDLRFEELHAEADELYVRALGILEAGQGNSVERLAVLNGIAMLKRAQDDLHSARATLERARAIPIDPRVPAECVQHARALEQLAWVQFALDSDGSHEADTEALLLEAVSLVEASVPCDYRELAEMRYRLSIYYLQRVRPAEAEANIVAALAAAEQEPDMDEQEVADYREHYSEVLTELERPDEAAEQMAEVERIWREVHTAPDPGR